MKKLWTGKAVNEVAMEKLVEALSASNDQLTQGLIQSNERHSDITGRLIEIIPELAGSTKNSARDLVKPIGSSCRTITQFYGTQNSSQIDEADAEAIRSDDMEVEDMEAFNCEDIRELNLNTGHCELKIEGIESYIKGKISDPALKQRPNIYTTAFNTAEPFAIQAKPVKKNGGIYRLYVSDARLINEP